MTIDEAAREIATFWLGRSGEAMESARAELSAGRISFAVNRSYFACFYAASAVLVLRGSRFVKHAGLRAAIHRDLVKPGDLSVTTGRGYDRLFDLRQQADYAELATMTPDDAAGALDDAEQIVDELRSLATAHLQASGG